MEFSQKPKTLVCYLCGREFGTSSLSIHLKNCIKKFQNQQSKKSDKSLQIKCPQPPQQLEQLLNGDLTNLHAYNEKASHIHKYKVLPSCRYCGRTFNEDSLKAHQKGCNKKDSKSVKKYADQQFLSNLPDNSKKPRTLICCVCGRQFGLTSLKIHYPKCLEKFKNEENKKPKAERKQSPQFTEDELDLINNKEDWSFQQIESFNKRANGNYRDNAMVQCANCKRKFVAQAYKKHKKNCVLINGKKQITNDTPSPTYSLPDALKKPRTLTCCVCGREFGLTSLKIHYPQCAEKFKNQEKKKPKSQRRPVPEFTEDQLDWVNNKQDWTQQEIEEFNQHANGNYRNNAMVQCPNCKRKFFEQSYQKHKKNCVLINGNKENGKSSAKSLKQNTQFTEEVQKKPRVLMCHICGRQFGLTSLLIHLKQCQVKFKNQQKKKPKQQRKPMPIFPDNEQLNLEEASEWSSQKIDQYNKIANNVYRSESLAACPICDRKFFEQSLPKHLKFCKKNAQKQEERSKSSLNREITSPNKSLQSNKSMQKLKIPAQQTPKAASKNLPSLKNKQKSPIMQVQGEHQSDNEFIEDSATQLSQSKPQSFLKRSFYRNMNPNIADDQQQVDKEIDSVQQAPSEMQETAKQKTKMLTKVLDNNNSDQQKFSELNESEKFEKSDKLDKLDQLDKPNKSDKPDKSDKSDSCDISDRNDSVSLNRSQLKTPKSRERSSTGFAALRKKQSIKQELMKQCSICNRKFDQDRLPKHEQKCKQSQIRSKMLQKNLQMKKKQSSNEPESLQTHKKIRNQEQQKLRQTLSPQQKIRMKKGFAAPRSKEEEHQVKLVQCKGCKRKFAEDRITKHENVCKKNQQLIENNKLSSQKKIADNLSFSEDIKSIKRVPCSGCNRKFAEDRIQKHLQVCKAHQNSKPFYQPPKKDKNNIYKQDLSKEAFQSQSQQLIKCNKCERKFIASRLSKHQDICKGNKAGDTANTQKRPSKSSQYNIEQKMDEIQEKQQMNLQQCPKCSRKFKSDRLAKHEEVCKGKTSSKRISEDNSKQNKNVNASKGKNQASSRSKIDEDKLAQAIEKSKQQTKYDLVQCEKCSRKFAVDRIQKHSQVCKGSSKKITENKLSKAPKSIKSQLQTQQVDNKKQAINKKPVIVPPLSTPRNSQTPKNLSKVIQSNTKNQENSEQLQTIGDDQYIQEQLEACEKCGRNFKLQRLQKHQQICKGTNKLGPKLQDKKLKIKEQQLRNTKNQFFNLVKDIKNKKVKQTDIDKQLDQELEQIQKTRYINRKQNKNNANNIRNKSRQSSHNKSSCQNSSGKKNNNIFNDITEKSVVLPKI